jgi:hypothetical protein
MEGGKARLPLADPAAGVTHIQVAVGYEKGGLSPLSGRSSRRGVYAYCQPISLKDGVVSFRLFAGKKLLLEELKRLDRKKVAVNVAAVENQLREERGPVWQLVLGVCDEEKLVLKGNA